eukprot:941227_1
MGTACGNCTQVPPETIDELRHENETLKSSLKQESESIYELSGTSSELTQLRMLQIETHGQETSYPNAQCNAHITSTQTKTHTMAQMQISSCDGKVSGCDYIINLSNVINQQSIRSFNLDDIDIDCEWDLT